MDSAGRQSLSNLSMSDPISYYGTPRTSEEWAALAKVASGHGKLSRGELRRLFMLGLVERQLGRLCLSSHGRSVLGIRDEYPNVRPAGYDRFETTCA